MNSLPDADMLEDGCHPNSEYQNNSSNEESMFIHMCTMMDVDPQDNNHRKETTKQQPKKQDKQRTREPYRKYTLQQIEKLFDLTIEEGKTAKEAALITGINIRIAQNYVKTYRDDEQMRLPGVEHKPRKGRPGKLNKEHSAFLLEFINQNPIAILADIKKSLCEAFDGLIISVSAMHRHLVEKCC